MVTSCTGHVLDNQRATTRGVFSSGSHLVTLHFQPHPFFSCVTEAVNGARSRFSAFYPKANYGLQGSQPSDVRAHNRAANGACDEYKQLKVLSMGRQKAVIKARREAKRVLRRDSRSHKQREEESVTSLVHLSKSRSFSDTIPGNVKFTVAPNSSKKTLKSCEAIEHTLIKSCAPAKSASLHSD